MATYKVTFEITVDDDAKHPRKWVCDAIDENLESGEFTEGWVFEEIPPTEGDKG